MPETHEVAFDEVHLEFHREEAKFRDEHADSHDRLVGRFKRITAVQVVIVAGLAFNLALDVVLLLR
jgi:hypothetical protein